MFWDYAEKEPLFVITLKESGDKLQLSKNDDDIQFMDEDDKTVSKEYVEQNWDLLKDIIKYTGSLSFIPAKYKTSELCKLAVQQNGCALFFIPKEFKTPELYTIAIKHGFGLGDVPDEYKTYELCELAVQQDGRALEFVPNMTSDGVALKSPEFCKKSCENNGEALAYVPKHLITPELCEIACKQNGMALSHVPAMTSDGVSLKTPELCKIALKQCCDNINDADYHRKMRALDVVLKHIPEDVLNPEMCEDFIKKDIRFIKKIPRKYLTPEFLKLCMEESIYITLCLMPKDLITYEICEYAIKQGYYQMQDMGHSTYLSNEEWASLKK